MIKIMQSNKLKVGLLFFLLFGIPAGVVKAEKQVNVTVKTVLASEESKFHDPRLADLIEELKSVFRYTSYRLLSHERLTIGIKKTGRVNLPGKRVLKITPVGISGNRAELKLQILRKRQQVFQTTIRLRNHGSITVGGPRHQKGYLLFNISNSF